MRLKPSYRGLLILTLLGVIFNLVSERSLVKDAPWQQEEARRSETAPRLLSPRASDRHLTKRAESTSSNAITLKEDATPGGQHKNTVMVQSSISTLAKVKARFPRNVSLASAGHHEGTTQNEKTDNVNATETVQSRNSSNHYRYQYHEWEESATIQLLPLLQLINKTFEPRKHVIHGPFPVFVAVQNNTPSLWISSQTMSWNKKDTILKKRLGHVLPHLQRALRVQLYEHQEQFPALMKALTILWVVSHCSLIFPTTLAVAIPTTETIGLSSTTQRLRLRKWPTLPCQNQFHATTVFLFPVPTLTNMPRHWLKRSTVPGCVK